MDAERKHRRIYLIEGASKAPEHRYVGATTLDLKRRLNLHRAKCKAGRDAPLYRAVRKYGWDFFSIHEIMAGHWTEQEADVKERECIVKYQAKLNDNEGGKSGWHHSEQARDKISARFAGKPLSDQHKKALSLANLGKPLSPEHKQAISEGRRKQIRKQKMLPNSD